MQREVIKLTPCVKELPKRLRTAGYGRVSSGKDAMLNSLSSQVSHYSELIQSNPLWEYVGVYADEAKTGTKDSRAQFQRMLNDCRTGKIDMIITKSISRFARNTLDLLNIVRELKSMNIDVYFERENIHTISPDGELMLSILASVAQEESLSVSENCKWRIRKRFENGELVNLRFLFGYKISKNSIQIDEKNAAVVRCIFEQYTSGVGCTKIAGMLRQLGIPTLRGGMWTANSVRNVILNEKYAGNALLQKKFISNHLTKTTRKNRGELPMYYAEGTHEPIIEKEVFDRAARILEENRKKIKTNKKPPKRYIFTGKIKCLNCGKNYKRRIYRGAVYWGCATYVSEGKDACHSKQIPEYILMSKASEALGINYFSEDVFKEKIRQIVVPEHGKLIFVFHDGNKTALKWHHKSRSESWSEEKRQKARNKALERMNKNADGKIHNSDTCDQKYF